MVFESAHRYIFIIITVILAIGLLYYITGVNPLLNFASFVTNSFKNIISNTAF